MSNSLDPDQARHFVEPDLGPNCLQKLSATMDNYEILNTSISYLECRKSINTILKCMSILFFQEFHYNISATTCDFQQCDILTSVDSDESVQPPFKLRNSKWCSVSSLTVIEYSSD